MLKNRKRRCLVKRFRYGIAAVLLITALVSAWAFIFRYLPSTTVGMHDQPIGANVSVTGDKVPRSIKAVETSTSANVAPEMQALGKTIQITPGGKLPAPVTLRFQFSQQIPADAVVLVMTREKSSDPWSFVAPTVSKDGHSLTVQTAHLSDWLSIFVPIGDLIKAFKEELLDGLTSDMTTQASKPHCNNDFYNESQAKHDGYAIGSSAKDTLYWCFGTEDGQRVLKIVNRKRYPLDVSHLGFTVKHEAGWKPELAQLARLVAGQSLLLFPFEEADFTVNLPYGQGALISTTYAGYAQGLYQLEVGVTTLLNILDRFGAGGGRISNGAIIKDSWDRITGIMSKFIQFKDCASVLLNLNPGKLISGCFTPADIMDAFGVKGLLLAPLMAIGQVVEFFQSEFSAIGDQFNDGDKYKIAVVRKDSGTGGSGGSGSGGGTGGTGGSGGTSSGGNSGPGGGGTGGSQSIKIGWSSSYSTYIYMTLNGFSAGSYQYTCHFGTGESATFTLSVASNPQTIDNGHTCYDTDQGDTVWVTIGSVKSNTITVPTSGGGGGTSNNASIQISWSSAHPTYIIMTLSGFTPGSYKYTCNFSTGGNGTFTMTISSNPQTIDNGHTCYDTVAGDLVWVTIGSVKSNTIAVAGGGGSGGGSGVTEVAGPAGAPTFTNYTNAGGTIGQRVAAYQSVKVTCRLTGFKVADGNTWWYKVASSPWNNTFYASADDFYNNGQTSGSLAGTPYYDPNVPLC